MALESPATFLYTNIDRLGIDVTFSRLLQRSHHIGRDVSIGRMIMVPSAITVIQELAPRYPLAVVSARHEEATRDFLTRFEMLSYFKAIATAHTCRYTKPYPDPIIWVARQLGVKPEECLMIGDTTVDVRAAKAAGAQAIGVLCGFGRQEDLLRVGADLVVPSIADVLQLLDNDTAAIAHH
jgi:phosphoglycolate phosphatase-like HAD superfamily hydrolase